MGSTVASVSKWDCPGSSLGDEFYSHPGLCGFASEALVSYCELNTKLSVTVKN